jgi:hypothetical protein
MHCLRFLPMLAGALLAPAAAQNLVQNGDFSAATIAPWVASNYAVTPGLETYDTSGTGQSQAYACNPGGQTTTPPFPKHVIEQTVTVAPILYELTLDVASTVVPSSTVAALPIVTVYLDNQVIVSKNFLNTTARRAVMRERLAVRFTPQAAGPRQLKVEFTFNGLAGVGRSPRVYVDNVDLRLRRDPFYAVRGERLLGASVAFEVAGTANAAYLVYLAPKKLPAPVTIPGFTGQLALDPSILILFLGGALDAQGSFKVTLPIPLITGLAGVPLHWQGIQLIAAGQGFGWESTQGFYQ